LSAGIQSSVAQIAAVITGVFTLVADGPQAGTPQSSSSVQVVPTSASGGPPASNSPSTSSNQTGNYVTVYRRRRLVLRSDNCAGGSFAELDDPSVNQSDGGDISFNDCPYPPPVLNAADAEAIAFGESATPEACEEGLRQDALQSTDKIEPGSIICVRTDQQRIVASSIVSITYSDMYIAIVLASAWERTG
jgi:hypothetical protein